MSANLGQVNLSSSFNTLFLQVNNALALFANQVVTANTTMGITNGSGFVSGMFGSNTVYALTIQGGNTTTVNTGYLGSNLNTNGHTLAVGNVTFNSIIDVGPNVVINSVGISIGNNLSSSSRLHISDVNSNAHVNSTAVIVTNGSITVPNASLTSNGLVLPTTNVNSSGWYINFGSNTAAANSSGFYFNANVIGTPAGGSNTNIQYSAGNNFVGSNGFTFNYQTNTVFIANTLNINNSSIIQGHIIFANTLTFNSSNVLPQVANLSITSGTVSWNVGTGVIGSITLTANAANIANPTSLMPGEYALIIKQDASGTRTIANWGTAYKFPAGIKPILTTTAGATDIISFVSDGTTMRGSFVNNLQ